MTLPSQDELVLRQLTDIQVPSSLRGPYRWRASRGTVRYLGEWHTHPEDYPIPSGLDRSEWRRLAAGRRDKRPQLSIIVGRHGLHVELVHSDGNCVYFQPHQ